MIYLKRFCFAIVAFLCMSIGGIIGTLLEMILMILYPIWGLICYVITGNTYLDLYDLSYSWEYSMKFLDWYKNKFGPNDD
jgi:hypothetical protein